MLFCSFEYILLFLPISIIGFFYFCYKKYYLTAKIWIIISSIFFYGWWNVHYIPLVLASVICNYIVGHFILTSNNYKLRKKIIFIIGITFNLILLGYFKYSYFLLLNINSIFNTEITAKHIILPLGISFFTFQQISFLCDYYHGEIKKVSFINYAATVTFFAHLIAGPIIRYKEIIPQFDSDDNKTVDYNNISKGLFIFFIGLFKKIIIADTLSMYAISGFASTSPLSFFAAWVTSLSFTFQLYFDFSGYTDMAIGSALMFNIVFPINFNSPYKALNIKDFWDRWHMTLSSFLRDYLYIPLGGNRKGINRTYINILITFCLCGFWHGAGWRFLFWGLLHAFALILHRIWNKNGHSLNRYLSWFLTFNFLNLTWIFFRAEKVESAINIITGMFGLNGITFSNALYQLLPKEGTVDLRFLICLILSFLILFSKNTSQLASNINKNWHAISFVIIIIVIMAVFSFAPTHAANDFIYFDF
ncbi:MAG: MBOAT family protein [Nitrospirae bacterium]|nr:MBOAT family protein [Nitrospirota bacterium]